MTAYGNKKKIRLEAIKLRKAGYSYNFINDKIKIPKSTLSNWLREVKYKPNRYSVNKSKSARLKTARTKRKNRKRICKEAKLELGNLTNRELKIAGAALYWGDGRKHDGAVSLVNSDPKMINFFVRWLGIICHVPKENIRAELHLYPDSKVEYLINFWSKTIGIPEEQFLKSQIDKREGKKSKKRGKLPYGTMHVYVKSGKERRYGYRLYEQIKGWIESISAGIAQW